MSAERFLPERSNDVRLEQPMHMPWKDLTLDSIFAPSGMISVVILLQPLKVYIMFTIFGI